MLDSPFGQNLTPYAQTIATTLVILAFIRSYRKNSSRLRQVMIIGLFIGFTGELIFSLGLGMYHYRLENIPLWVGFGHSLIFASVHKIIRIPYLLKHKDTILKTLLAFIVIYSTSWFIFKNDVFGFITTVIFLALLVLDKKSKMFFTVMFVIVVYIELVGTAMHTWYWPNILMSKFDIITSANPPSGIALFYFLFDYIVLFIYLRLKPKLRARYKLL